jgi:hypothetical protein
MARRSHIRGNHRRVRSAIHAETIHEEWAEFENITLGTGLRPHNVLGWAIDLENWGVIIRRKKKDDWKFSKWRLLKGGKNIVEAIKECF